MAIRFNVSLKGSKKAFGVKPGAFQKLSELVGQYISTEVEPHVKQNAVTLFKTHPTGDLARRIFVVSEPTSTGAAGQIYTNVPYARVQEEGTGYLPGGVIRAKKKYLTIPAKASLTPSGKARFTIQQARSRYAFFRWIPYKKKGELRYAVIGYKSKPKEGDKGTPLFWLVHSVRIKGKHYFRLGIEKANMDLGEYLTTKIKDLIN